MMPFETVFGHLIRKTLYAVRSNDELLIYEAYGAMTMARAGCHNQKGSGVHQHGADRELDK